MSSLIGARKIACISVCTAAGLFAAFTQYVHTGYVGVVDGGRPVRLLDRGLHVRAPWQRVVFYPVRGNSVGITTTWMGPTKTIRAEMSIVMSVSSDSVASLHTAYGGEYIEALVVPRVNEFFRLRSDAWGDRLRESVVNEMDKDLAVYLNASLAPRGINIFQAWLVSVDVSAESLE